jgi:hypothetical protein
MLSLRVLLFGLFLSLILTHAVDAQGFREPKRDTVIVYGADTAGAEFHGPSSGPLRSYLGISGGTPAYANLVFAHYNRNGQGVRLSGGFLPKAHDGKYSVFGFQADICWKLAEGSHSLLDIALVFGFASTSSDYATEGYYERHEVWRYFGGGVSLKMDPVFIQVGMSTGWGLRSRPQLIAQFGLVANTGRY